MDERDIISHPEYYGGSKNDYEAIKVIEAWGLNFSLGNVIKYISRAGKKDSENTEKDLKKALWYLERHINNITNNKEAFYGDNTSGSQR